MKRQRLSRRVSTVFKRRGRMAKHVKPTTLKTVDVIRRGGQNIKYKLTSKLKGRDPKRLIALATCLVLIASIVPVVVATSSADQSQAAQVKDVGSSKTEQKSSTATKNIKSGNSNISVAQTGNDVSDESKTGKTTNKKDTAKQQVEKKNTEPEVFRKGTQHAKVKQIQERLMKLNYMEEDEPTDYYGYVTDYAMQLFQRKHNLDIDGSAGKETLDLLFSKKATKYTVSLDDSGTDIKELQARLIELGYMSGKPTGKFGETTQKAVKYFQERNKLETDGKVGENTRDVIYSEDPKRAAMAIGEEGSSVTKLQKRLIALNYLETEATGYFGEATEQAVKDFQDRNGLSADGKAGRNTLELIYSKDAKKQAVVEQEKEDKKKDNSKKSNTRKRTNNKKDDKKKPSHNTGVKPGRKLSGRGVGALVSVAGSLIGKPYIRGAKGPNAFDCSGFVYYCLKQAGAKLGYMTSGGWAGSSYTRVGSFNDIKKGDILCFRGHVGIYIGGGTMIDASSSRGRVKRTSISSPYWRRNFICARRVF